MRGFFHKFLRILFLSLLVVSVIIPVFLLSHRLKHISYDVSDEFGEDLSIILSCGEEWDIPQILQKATMTTIFKHRVESQTLSVLQQVESEILKEPFLVVYKDNASSSEDSFSLNEDTKFRESRVSGHDANLLEKNAASRYYAKEASMERQREHKLLVSGKEGPKVNTVELKRDNDASTVPRRTLDEKVNEMKDQVVRAKAYLNFTPANSSSHFVKELKLRIKDIQRAMSQCTKDSRMCRSALQKMKAMESTLSKASRIYPDCAAMVKKLRAMTYNAEEQVQTQQTQETFLKDLGWRTIPKGLHCLSMRLTADYYTLEPEEREFPNKHKLQDPNLYHIAVFSDNILACSVVVNSTIASAKEPERVVFHIVTDFLNFPSMSMWFLSNAPRKATVHVESADNFQWLSTKYNVTLQNEDSVNPRYTSELNHLRFYLPDVFPHLNKIILLDHDVVVQKDLTRLWSFKLKGKVHGAVQTCVEGEPSYRRMDMFINFTDPIIASKFDDKECTWAFGLNLFDLQEWRRKSLTQVYLKNLKLGKERPLWKAGSLPIGWVTFYKQTVPLNKRWHVLGLGYDSGVSQEDIAEAAVIHFDGNLKPWLDTGLEKYKHLWSKHVKYAHPFLQHCNIHG